jgi:RNA polymerase sigma-70 factor (ECF subfamily)
MRTVEKRHPKLSREPGSAHEDATPSSASVYRLSGGPSDAELVVRIQRGDRWAEEALYRRYVDLVSASALRLLRNRAEAEDVVQETFLLAFQRLHQLRDVQALRAWLLRLTLTRVHRRFRWHRLRRWFGACSLEEEGLEDAAAPHASGEDRAELALVETMLEKLKAQDRAAWLLRHAVGCSLEEVAEACGCSLAAAKRRIRAADEALEKALQRRGKS